MAEYTKPQVVRVIWIDNGTQEESFEIVPPVVELDYGIKFRLNDRNWREVNIPYTNLKLWVVEK